MGAVYWPRSIRRALDGLGYKAETGPQLAQIGQQEADSNMQAAGWQPAEPPTPQPATPLPAIELPSLDEMVAKWKPQPAPVQQPTASGTPAMMPTGVARPVDGSVTMTQGQRTAGAQPQAGEQIGSVQMASGPAPTGDIDNSSREAFVRTAWPHMLQAAGGDQNLAKMMLAKAISENGDIGKGGEIIGWNVSGIKGEGDAGSFEADTWEDYGNGRVNIRDKFAAYSGPEAGFGAFMQFLRDNPRYHGALQRYQQTGNVEQLFDDVNAAGYATDPIWSQKLRNIRDTQVEPVIRQLTGDPRQSMTAGSAAPAAAGPASQAAAGGSSTPAAAPALPPQVAMRWRQQFGRDPDPEEAAQLMSVIGGFA